MRKAEAYASLLNEIPQVELAEPIQLLKSLELKANPAIYIDDEFLVPLEKEVGLPVLNKEVGLPGLKKEADPELRSRLSSIQQALRREALRKAERERESELREQTINKLNRANALFESQRQRERLRQARWSFNLAFALSVLGTLIVLFGVALLLRDYTTTGVMSSAAGAVSNISGAVVFKFNREANDRLDKIQINITKITSLTKCVELIDKVEEDQPQPQI